MHQRKEKVERSSQNPVEAVLSLLPVLETSDYHNAGNVMNMICEGLNENKDSKVLNGIVDYYVTVDSYRIIDILVRSKEPHDKHLFDKIYDLMKNESHRYKSVQLLMNLVYRQPSWLHKIANHRILNLLINLLKTDQNAPTLMCGLFTLTSLLSIIPGQFIPFLNDTFEVFTRIASWSGKKPGFIVDVHSVHLQAATSSLFQRLYGLFPYNFLVYLRSVYLSNKVSEDNVVVFNKVINPLVKRVKLHPFLVNATKEQELEPKRFKRMAYHDVVVECASYCIDRPTEPIRNILTSSNEHNLCSFDSAQLNCSNQSSCSVNYETDAVNEPESSRDLIWTPNDISNISTPQTSTATSPLTLKSETVSKSYSRQISSKEVPLDIAVEAKPELLKMEPDHSLSSLQSLEDKESKKGGPEITNNNSISQNTVKSADIVSALEAKEDDVDQEVLELTSKTESNTTMQSESRHTSSVSTTQNMTDKPLDFFKSSLERAGSLTKSHEEEIEEMLNSFKETVMKPFNEYDCFGGYCGMSPCISPSIIKPAVVSRSLSCPDTMSNNEQKPAVMNTSNENARPDSVDACSSNIASDSAFRPVSNDDGAALSHKIATYEELIPYSHPIDELRRIQPEYFETQISQNSIVNSLSPSRLLDHSVQNANEAALGHSFAVPITSTFNTDWTHFGGKAPPDEFSILRTRTLLLQDQLEFERHRKDVHSERNRRILGRVKKLKMEYDQFESLKKKVALLEQENKDLRNQSVKNCKLYQHLQAEMHKQEKTFCGKMLILEKKNTELENAATEYRQLLIQDKEKFNEIHELNKKCQLDITLLKHQLEYSNKKMLQCQRIERDSIYLSKQLTLLQELVRKYKEKIEMHKETQQTDIGAKLTDEAATLEIKDLKQKLESKSYQVDSTKGKIADLEHTLEDLKTKQRDHMRILETMKSFHKDDIMILKERLEGLKKISIQKDAHILNLYKDMETLLEEKTVLEKQLNGDANATTASYKVNEASSHIQPRNVETTDPTSYKKDVS